MSLNGRVVLVTGASRGLGRAASIALAKAGAHIVAVARTVGGLEELDDEIRSGGGEASLVPMDLTDGAAVDRLGAEIHKRWGRLDGLFGNAGQLGVLTPIPHLRTDTWNKILDINLTANWRMIRSVDPLLRESNAGRALFVTSGAPRNCRPFWGAYSITKAGLEALVRTYAGEMTSSNVKANLIDPGPMRTSMRATAMPGEDPETVPEPSTIAPHVVDMLSPSFNQTGVMYDVRAGGITTFA